MLGIRLKTLQIMPLVTSAGGILEGGIKMINNDLNHSYSPS